MAPWLIPSLLSLAPAAIGSMMPRPKAPSYQAPELPDRSFYSDQMLDTAFNPNSHIWELAQAQAMEEVGKQLANRGMNYSSQGGGMMSRAASDLANKFLMSELDRQSKAYGAVTQRDLGIGNLEQNAANQAYSSAMNKYNSDMSGMQNLIGGIGNAVSTGYGFYQNQQMLDELNNWNVGMRAMYGTPTYNSSSGASPGQAYYNVNPDVMFG